MDGSLKRTSLINTSKNDHISNKQTDTNTNKSSISGNDVFQKCVRKDYNSEHALACSMPQGRIGSVHDFKFSVNGNKSKKRIAPVTVKTNNYVIIDKKTSVEKRKSDEICGRYCTIEQNKNPVNVEESSGNIQDRNSYSTIIKDSKNKISTIQSKNTNYLPDKATLKNTCARKITNDILKESVLPHTTKHNYVVNDVSGSDCNIRIGIDKNVKSESANEVRNSKQINNRRNQDKKTHPSEENLKATKRKLSERLPEHFVGKSKLWITSDTKIASDENTPFRLQKSSIAYKSDIKNSCYSGRKHYLTEESSAKSNEESLFDNEKLCTDKLDLKLRNSFKTPKGIHISNSDNSGQSWYTPPSYLQHSFQRSPILDEQKREFASEGLNCGIPLDKSCIMKDGQVANEIIDKFIERCVTSAYKKEIKNEIESTETLALKVGVKMDANNTIKNRNDPKLFHLLDNSSYTLSEVSYTSKKTKETISYSETSVSSLKTNRATISSADRSNSKISRKSVDEISSNFVDSRCRFKPVDEENSKLDHLEKQRLKQMMEVIKCGEKKLLELELRKEEYRVKNDNESIKALKKKQRAILLKVYANMQNMDKSMRSFKEWFSDDFMRIKSNKILKETSNHEHMIHSKIKSPIINDISSYSDYHSTHSSSHYADDISSNFEFSDKDKLSRTNIINDKIEKKCEQKTRNSDNMSAPPLAVPTEEIKTYKVKGVSPVSFQSSLSKCLSDKFKESPKSFDTNSSKESSNENSSLNGTDIRICHFNNKHSNFRSASNNMFEILPCINNPLPLTSTLKKYNKPNTKYKSSASDNFREEKFINRRTYSSIVVNSDCRKLNTSLRGSTNTSEDSIILSLNESTISDQSDVEFKILALQEKLNERKLEASRLRSMQRQLRRDQLKAQEISLIKQIEAYDRYIEKITKELSVASLNYASNTTVTRPQIKKPQKLISSERIKCFGFNYGIYGLNSDFSASRMQDAETQFSLISQTDYENNIDLKINKLKDLTNIEPDRNDEEATSINSINISSGNLSENKENYQLTDECSDKVSINVPDDELIHDASLKVDAAFENLISKNKMFSDDIIDIPQPNQISDSSMVPVAINHIADRNDVSSHSPATVLPHFTTTESDVHHRDNVFNLINYLDELNRKEEQKSKNSSADSTVSLNKIQSEVTTTEVTDASIFEQDSMFKNDTLKHNNIDDKKNVTDADVIHLPPFDEVFNDIFISQLRRMTDGAMIENIPKNLIGHVEYNPETESILLKVEEIPPDLSSHNNGIVITEYKSEESTSKTSTNVSTSDEGNFVKTDDAQTTNSDFNSVDNSSTLIDAITAEDETYVNSIPEIVSSYSVDDNSLILVQELSEKLEDNVDTTQSEFTKLVADEVCNSSKKIVSLISSVETSQMNNLSTVSDEGSAKSSIVSEVSEVHSLVVASSEMPDKEYANITKTDNASDEIISSDAVPVTLSDRVEENKFESKMFNEKSRKKSTFDLNFLTNLRNDESLLVSTDVSLSFLDKNSTSDDDSIGDDIIEANWRDAKQLMEENEKEINKKAVVPESYIDGTENVISIVDSEKEISYQEDVSIKEVVEELDPVVADTTTTVEQSDSNLMDIEERTNATSSANKGQDENVNNETNILDTILNENKNSITSDLDSLETDDNSNINELSQNFNSKSTHSRTDSKINSSEDEKESSKYLDDVLSMLESNKLLEELVGEEEIMGENDIDKVANITDVYDDRLTLKSNQLPYDEDNSKRAYSREISDDKESNSDDTTSREQDVSIEELIENHSFPGGCMETFIIDESSCHDKGERFDDTVIDETVDVETENKRKFVENTVETIIAEMLEESIDMKKKINESDSIDICQSSFDMNAIGQILTENETPLLQALTRDQERQAAVKSAHAAESIITYMYNSIIEETVFDTVRIYLEKLHNYKMTILNNRLTEVCTGNIDEVVSIISDADDNIQIISGTDVHSSDNYIDGTITELTREDIKNVKANFLLPDNDDKLSDSSENSDNKYVEAARLRLEQMRIEQEIEHIQSQQIPPYVFFREIPNKPPPPYTPPSKQDVRKIPDTEDEILEYVENFVGFIYDDIQNGINFNDIEPSPNTIVSNNENDVDVYARFLFDLSKELMERLYQQRLNEDLSSLPWDKTKSKWKYRFIEKFDKQTLTKTIKNEILTLLGMKSKIARENSIISWSKKKKTDYVDVILINELQEEEPEWICYEQDELNIKNRIVNDLLDELISDAASSVHNNIGRRSLS